MNIDHQAFMRFCGTDPQRHQEYAKRFGPEPDAAKKIKESKLRKRK